MSVNKVILVGRLGKDPETRYMTNGEAVTNVTLATSENWKDKFWKKIAKNTKDQCWGWLGAKKPTGYGNVRINKAYKNAHRVAWELTYGTITAGMHVLHSCDNSSCCNPHHLMLGTSVSNRVDMVRKGRANYGHTANRPRGLNNHNGKLNSEQVARIRMLYVPGITKQADIAAQFGVSQRLISLIVRGKARTNG